MRFGWPRMMRHGIGASGLVCAFALGLAACTPPVRQYALNDQQLTCPQANDYSYRTLQGLGFAITTFEPAAIGRPGRIRGSREERGTQNVTVTITCLPSGSASIDASEDWRWLGQVDFKRAFYMAFTAVAAQTSIREAAVREEAQRPPEQKKQKGLRVQLEPVAGLGAKLDFDLDLAAGGVLPVRVTINNASTRSYRFDPGDVVLIQRDGTRVHPLALGEAVERVAAAQRQQNNGAQAAPADDAGIARRLEGRLLRAHAVAANQQLSGYLYFPLGTYAKGRVTLEDQESEEAEGVVVEF